MESLSVARLRQQAELLVALSILHLTSETRTALADDNLSVNAYPTGCGGFVYVGTPRYRVPAEPDQATIFEAAKRAGVAWLMFDRNAAAIDGLQGLRITHPRTTASSHNTLSSCPMVCWLDDEDHPQKFVLPYRASRHQGRRSVSFLTAKVLRRSQSEVRDAGGAPRAVSWNVNGLAKDTEIECLVSNVTNCRYRPRLCGKSASAQFRGSFNPCRRRDRRS
jgi:hypothetical protein